MVVLGVEVVLGLGEMFEGDFADTCAEKYPLKLTGAEWSVKRAQPPETRPHLREQNYRNYYS